MRKTLMKRKHKFKFREQYVSIINNNTIYCTFTVCQKPLICVLFPLVFSTTVYPSMLFSSKLKLKEVYVIIFMP